MQVNCVGCRGTLWISVRRIQTNLYAYSLIRQSASCRQRCAVNVRASGSSWGSALQDASTDRCDLHQASISTSYGRRLPNFLSPTGRSVRGPWDRQGARGTRMNHSVGDGLSCLQPPSFQRDKSNSGGARRPPHVDRGSQVVSRLACVYQ